MKRHPDCEDGCQLHEHKGYTSCFATGECAYAEEDFDDKRPIFEERDTDDQARADRRARARDMGAK